MTKTRYRFWVVFRRLIEKSERHTIDEMKGSEACWSFGIAFVAMIFLKFKPFMFVLRARFFLVIENLLLDKISQIHVVPS